MKMKKALLLVLCAVLLVAASVMGTMAYLTSNDSVQNTFTVGNVAITMDESNVDGKDAEGNDNASVARDDANKYHLLPGQSYTKDPQIHVDDESEDCYLFVKVVNELANIEANADGKDTVVDQMTAGGAWTLVEGQSNVYVYKEVVSAGDDVDTFNTLYIAESVNNATLADYEGKSITVTAYAIQAAGFEGKTAADIWAAGGW